MRIVFEIETGNAAFHDDHGQPDPVPEVVNIIRTTLDDWAAFGQIEGRPLWDINGNAVGQVSTWDPVAGSRECGNCGAEWSAGEGHYASDGDEVCPDCGNREVI